LRSCPRWLGSHSVSFSMNTSIYRVPSRASAAARAPIDGPNHKRVISRDWLTCGAPEGLLVTQWREMEEKGVKKLLLLDPSSSTGDV
jgi:hypothetical protein